MKKKITLIISNLVVLMFNLYGQLVNPNAVIITRETFGIYQFDTGTNGTTIDGKDYVPYNTSSGFNPKWTYDSIYALMREYGDTLTAFTSKNGRVISISSDKSIRINRYDGPAPTESWASGMSWLLMTPAGRYSGSWDSIKYENISIKGYRDLSLSFFFKKRNNSPQSNDYLGLEIYYSIDGSNYVLLDTGQLAINTPVNTWSWGTINFPSNVQGEKLDLVFAITKSLNQIYIDDITLEGWTLANICATIDSIYGEGGKDYIDVDDGTLQMFAKTTPEGVPVIWKVESITGGATIDKNTGLLKATGNGIVKVIAQINDPCERKAEKIITISNQVTPVQSITISYVNNKNALNFLGDTLRLVATVLPDYATNKTVTWSLVNQSDAQYVNIDQTGKVTYIKIVPEDKTIKIRATANDGSGVYAERNIYAKYTSIKDVRNSEISIYPIPVKDVLYIKNSSIVNKVEIHDITGKLVISENIVNSGALDVSTLNKGIYFIKIFTKEGKIYSGKFVK